jgi:hypothetical protein
MRGTFGEIRSAVQERPSATSWHALYEAIAEVDITQFAEELLPYVAENLKNWPDELRVCPQDWLDLLLNADLVHPGLVLVRRLWRPHLELGDLKKIANTSEFSQVTRFGLVSNGLGPKAVRLLLDGPALQSVEFLDLSYNRIGDKGVLEFCRNKKAARLRHLSLDNNGITDEGAMMLANCEHLEGLERLTLFGNLLGSNGHDAIRTSGHLSPAVRREWAFADEL